MIEVSEGSLVWFFIDHVGFLMIIDYDKVRDLNTIIHTVSSAPTTNDAAFIAKNV